MKDLIKGRLEGLQEQMFEFHKKLDRFKGDDNTIGEFNKLVLEEMKELEFDSYTTDRFDNTIGVINGYRQGQDIALIFPVDYTMREHSSGTPLYGNGMRAYKPGIVTALYSAALLKRSLLPMTGDILVCGVPRSGCCGFGIKYLFEYYLRKRIKQLKGIILCEPTDMNLYLGHKGRMEYEIVVKLRMSDSFMAGSGVNMLGTMFPLIHELEAVSHTLPTNYTLGNSSLRIKGVHFSKTKPKDNRNEFRVVVDRVFIPEEQEENILEKAKMIAKAVYKGEPSVMVQTAVAQEKIRTCAGANVVSEKEIKPWTMESAHPFVADSLQALRDNGFQPGFGYWKHIITEGSYTFGELGIPTFGFGPGFEIPTDKVLKPCGIDLIKKAVYAQAMMIHRNIGIPTFGWTSDEI